MRWEVALATALLASSGAAGCGDDGSAMCLDSDASMPVVDGGMTGDPDGGMPPTDAGGDVDGGPMVDGGPPPVEFTETEWAIIHTLSPLPEVPADTTNAFADDPEAAALGQALFFDARYSGALAEDSDLGMVPETGRVSCASCHSSPVMSDDRSDPDNVSLGAGFHTRNSPALVNSSFYPWTNWGGRFSAQWELPLAVTESGVIMNSTRLTVVHHLFDNYRTEYEAIFGPMEPAIGTDLVRFPPTAKPVAAGMPPGPWEMMTAADQDIVKRIMANFGKALEAYVRLLVSEDAPFDRFVAGDDSAISESAKRGLRLFIGDARCVSCHSGPTLSDGSFHNIGVQQTGPHVPMTDDGRFTSIPPLLTSPLNTVSPYSDDIPEGMRRLAGLTNPPPESTRGAFRTPTLRNVTLSAPYMHSGQMGTLDDVMGHYNAGGDEPVAGRIDMLMHPLGLTEEEIADVIEFMRSLESPPIPEALRTDPG